MTILPGHPIAPPDVPPPAEPPRAPREPRGPRHGVGSRALVIAMAGVVALAGAGSWYAIHSSGSGGSAPAASSAPVVHRHAPALKPGTFAAPHARAGAMQVATKVFAVLPAQLPGWRVEGATAFDGGDATGADPVSRATAKCVAGVSSPGLAVDSPDVYQRTATPTYMSVSAQLGFVRTPARAAADLAVISRASVRQCVARGLVGRTVSMGAGSSLKFTAMKPLRVPAHSVGLEFDGVITSNIVGDQAVRVVMLFAVDRATEVVVTSTGLGAALPLSTDLRVLHAITTQTHRVIA